MDLVPGRALTFLRGVGTAGTLYAALASAGFTTDDLDEGWALLRRACTTVSGPTAIPPNPARDALKELQAWRTTAFARARAALRRMHPAEESFLFGGVVPAVAKDAMSVIMGFLDRCDALERGAKRASTRKQDAAALATLEKRGITKAERARIARLVAVATTSLPPESPPLATPSMAVADVVALHAWLQDWSKTARTVLTRRDELLRLGLGKRRPVAKVADSEAITPRA
jgi:hypothetical protein